MQNTPSLSKPRQRIVYFDYLESIAIYFVTSLHFYALDHTIPTNILWFVYRTCIPLFFMVHGALLLEREQTLAQIGRRIRKVLLQLFGWNFIYLLLSLATGLLQWTDLTPDLFYRVFLNTEDSGGIPSYHLWFSYALISVYLILPLIQVCKKHADQLLKYILGVCFVFSVVRLLVYAYGTYFGQLGLGFPVTLDELCRQFNPFGQYSIHLFYFIGGWYFHHWIQGQKDRRRLLWTSGALFVVGELLMLPEQFMAHGTLAFSDGLPAEYQRLGIVLMSAGIFLFFSQLNLERCPLNGVACLVGSHTLDIYYLHIIFGKLLSIPVEALGWSGIFFNALRALLVLLLSLGCGLVLRRVPVLRKLLS